MRSNSMRRARNYIVIFAGANESVRLFVIAVSRRFPEKPVFNTVKNQAERLLFWHGCDDLQAVLPLGVVRSCDDNDAIGHNLNQLVIGNRGNRRGVEDDVAESVADFVDE